MRKILLVLFIIAISMSISAQENARNGHAYSPQGTLRLFIVFADIVDDPYSDSIWAWPIGQLPDYVDNIIDQTVENIPQGYLSKYFQEASCGNLHIIGDYYPELIELHTSDLNNNSIGFKEVVRYLDTLPGNDITTKHGYHLSDFDKWDFTEERFYMPATSQPDNRMDLFVIVWRRNSLFSPQRSGGCCVGRDTDHLGTIKGFRGFNGYIIVCHDESYKCIRHELGHTFVGPNEFHTGGSGSGSYKYFLPNIGGYSVLSSFNCNIDSYNGFDRWRVGWKNPNNTFYISARNTMGNEVSTDLVYGETLSDSIFILRDFARYGDAIRIKLPYVKSINSASRNQYVWIENHQTFFNSTDYNNHPQGIRVNLQIGNDDLYNNLDSSCANHFVPLTSFGNYDFDYYPFNDVYTAYSFDELENPLTGNHPIMMPATDFTGNDSIEPKEFLNVERYYRNGALVLTNHPIFANKYEIFKVNSVINICSNPSPASVLTYINDVPSGGHMGIANEVHSIDNRNIFLNGLRIEIIQIYLNGNIKVKIKWDDFKVTRNVRWCGPIVLTEQVDLMPDKTITIDMGLTPTHPLHPIIFHGQKVFADPTVFTCRNHSLFHQEAYSKVKVKNLSTLVLEDGSEYVIEDHAMLNIDSSACLIVKSGATLRVKGSGHVDVRKGGYICIESGANIILEDKQSSLSLHKGYIAGTSPDSPSGCNCTNSPQNFATSGQGNIHSDYNYITFIQKRTYTGTAYETGRKVRAGYQVDFLMPYGNVNINNGADVIFDADLEVRLEPGFSVKQGAKFEARCGSN